MKKILLLLLLSSTAYAQIPNPSFENWSTTSFLDLMGWAHFGQVTRVTPATNGTYAVRMERTDQNSPGAIIYGSPQGNNFYGGIPYNARPDTLEGDFKYNIASGDSAWVLIIFKVGGVAISNDLYFITGNNSSNFIHKKFKVNYQTGQTPDTLIIGFTSSNPNNSIMGGYMILDNLYFTGNYPAIPNGSFENWVTIMDEEPVNWFTSNAGFLQNNPLPVTKTTDRFQGSYAIRIENITVQNGMGYALAGPQGQNGPEPGFPVAMRDTTFNGYYKFYPQNGDTLTIGLMMFEAGVQVGGAFLSSNVGISTYTPFSIPIYYNMNYTGTPDSATIFLLPFQGGGQPYGNSVLYVDDLSLDVLLTNVEQPITRISNADFFPNPFRSAAELHYTVVKEGKVKVVLYDMTGREIAILFNGDQSRGSYSMGLDGAGLENGMYHIVIENGDARVDQKIILQK